MMQRVLTISSIVLFAIGLLGATARVEAKPKLVIQSAEVDFDTLPGLLTLTGDFDTKKPVEVRFDGKVLVLQRDNETVITAELPGAVESGTHRVEVSEIKGLIGLCHFFIGSRMPACIAALSQGVPAVGIAYSQKFRGVFDTVGPGELVLNARELTAEELVEGCPERYGRREEIARALGPTLRRAQACIREYFERELSETNKLGGAELAETASDRPLQGPARKREVD